MGVSRYAHSFFFAPVSRLSVDGFGDQGGDEGDAVGQARQVKIFLRGVRAAAHRAEGVERRRADGGGEVAVRAAARADRLTGMS